MFHLNHEVIVPSGLTDDERFNYIFNLVHLMKIDERLYKDEILYCSEVASKLGYNQSVMFELMLHVREVMEPTNGIFKTANDQISKPGLIGRKN